MAGNSNVTHLRNYASVLSSA